MRSFPFFPCLRAACTSHAADAHTPVAGPRIPVRPLLVLLVLSLLVLSLTACTMQPNSFDSDTWKSQRGVMSDANKRGALIADLDQHLKPGMNRASVLQLLGEPDYTDAESSTDVYRIGRSPYGIDSESYELQYRDDRLESYRLSRS